MLLPARGDLHRPSTTNYNSADEHNRFRRLLALTPTRFQRAAARMFPSEQPVIPTGAQRSGGTRSCLSLRSQVPHSPIHPPAALRPNSTVIPTGAQHSGGTCSCFSLRSQNLSISEWRTTRDLAFCGLSILYSRGLNVFGSINVLGVSLSIVPLFLTYMAWRTHRHLNPLPSHWRTMIFRAGLVASCLCAVMTVCCWLAPFPLADGNGGYSDVRNDVLYAAAVITALITLVSASFGGRSSRLLLWGAALVQLVLAYLAVLQNAV